MWGLGLLGIGDRIQVIDRYASRLHQEPPPGSREFISANAWSGCWGEGTLLILAPLPFLSDSKRREVNLPLKHQRNPSRQQTQA